MTFLNSTRIVLLTIFILFTINGIHSLSPRENNKFKTKMDASIARPNGFIEATIDSFDDFLDDSMIEGQEEDIKKQGSTITNRRLYKRSSLIPKKDSHSSKYGGKKGNSKSDSDEFGL